MCVYKIYVELLHVQGIFAHAFCSYASWLCRWKKQRIDRMIIIVISVCYRTWHEIFCAYGFNSFLAGCGVLTCTDVSSIIWETYNEKLCLYVPRHRFELIKATHTVKSAAEFMTARTIMPQSINCTPISGHCPFQHEWSCQCVHMHVHIIC